MPEEAITNRQAATLAVTFIICNAYSLIYGTSSGRDVWIAYIAATILAIFVWSLATRRMERSPGKSFFAIVELSFGRIFGRVIIVTLVLFALLSCTTSIGLFTRAAQLTALSKTPQIILPLAMLLCAAWSLYGGLSVIARTASLLFYFSIATFLYFLLSGLPLLDLRNIMPIMSHNLLNTARSALSVFTNEFGDMILLLAMYTEIKRTKTRRKTMIIAMSCAGTCVCVIAAMTVLTLGGAQTDAEFFPVFTTLSVRNIGGYIQHMEIVTSIAMTFFVFTRQALTLYFIASGLAHLAHVSVYRKFLVPTALIIVSVTQLLYWNMMSLRARLEGDLNLYIALPITLVFPLIFAVIERRRAP